MTDHDNDEAFKITSGLPLEVDLDPTSPLGRALARLEAQTYDARGEEREFADQFLNKAKQLVLTYISHRGVDLSMNEVYIPWFSKTLQNWKATVSTIYSDGIYFEVTYNGDKKESYIDVYLKNDNLSVTDEEFDAS